MLVFIISGLVILAYCSQASNERTYQEVVWAVCGKLTGVLCEVAIATYTFGTCIAFLIIIGDQQDKSEVPLQYLPHPSPLALGILQWAGKSMEYPPKALTRHSSGILPAGCCHPGRDGGPCPAVDWHHLLSFLPLQL